MNPNWGNFPRWLTEGVAEWSATAAVTYDDFESYLNFRNHQDLGSQYGNDKVYDEAYISKFLNPELIYKPGLDINSYLNSYPHWDAYSLGFMVAEILVTLKNQDSLIKLLQNINSGLTFAQSFKMEFGVEWNEAAPLIAKAIANEIRNNVKK